jgi:hypothetical protein
MSADMSAEENAMIDLATLVAPMQSEEFFADYWEKKPLHHKRGDARAYERLLTDTDLDRIISSGDLRYPSIQLVKSGSYCPPEVYTRDVRHGSEVFHGVPDIDKIRSEYRDGATVVLLALHRTWGPLKALCASLESQLNHAMHTNVYLTAGNTAGLSPHYDTHDVFVLQIGGKKRWRLAEPPMKLPHRSQPSPRGGLAAPPPPTLELDMEPGDLLYFPRGYVHSTTTSDKHSTHVTIGIAVYTWVELLGDLLLASKSLPSFREALPPGFAARGDLKGALKEGLLERLDELRGTADIDGLVDTFTQRIRASWPRGSGSFQSNVRIIVPRTELAAPKRGSYAIATEGGSTILQFEGKKLVLPGGVRPTLEAMGARASFRPADLPKNMGDEATLGLVRYLEGEGFLRQVQ